MITALVLALCAASGSQQSDLFVLQVPDSGWSLWLDQKADWRKEKAFLPDETVLSQVTPQQPTIGWTSLYQQKALMVTLPTTVEEHMWGVNGLRPYKGEYFYEAQDPDPKNGNYIGVSWWWQSFSLPESFKGKSITLNIRGAKQLAEVFVNDKLVGYSMLAESAFKCDITKAALIGKPNRLAIRITNPGGRLDWGDWSTSSLGGIAIYGGHAFGGLDRGMTIEAHGKDYIESAWVLNRPEPKTVEVHASVQLQTKEADTLIASVIDPTSNKEIAREQSKVQGNEAADAKIRISVPSASLWKLDHPKLYKLRIWLAGDPKTFKDVSFGFRWFAPEGIGSNAVLKFNGERIRIFSAISWGFCGMNGLWPTPYLAEKEVKVAKQLGLNAVNFHRNVARTESLDAADRLGLLRYTEPGGGMVLFWNNGPKDDSFQRYMLSKIRQMVRDHRSHPSLMMYVVQNELNDDSYKHRMAEKAVRLIHSEDPSRVVVLKSGLGGPGQMLMLPYDDNLYVDKGDGYSGWFDEHTVGYPDSWNDANYEGPEKHIYRNRNQKEIVDYGEMGGSGVGDNPARMIRQIQALGGKSYDLLDHQEVNKAYNAFLDKFGFRSAFPTTEKLFDIFGSKQYEYWHNVMLTSRLSDEIDYLTLSGWESTAVENHSGIVDNLRNPHGDPKVLASALRPVMPSIQLRQSSVSAGGQVKYDLFFLNETPKPVVGQIEVLLRAPDGKESQLAKYEVPKWQKDRFVYPIAEALETPKLAAHGRYTLIARLGKVEDKREVFSILIPKPAQAKLYVSGGSPTLAADLEAVGYKASNLSTDAGFDVAISASAQSGQSATAPDPAFGTPDPELYKIHHYGKPDNLRLMFDGLPNGPAKVKLGFVEGFFDRPGNRVFDVTVNGKTVIQDLDLFVKVGKNQLYKVEIDTEVVDGKIVIAPGKVKVDNAMFNTVEIEANGVSRAYYFGNKPYKAKDGKEWLPYANSSQIPSAVLDQVKAGKSLIVMSDEDTVTESFAKQLASLGVFRYDGLVGKSPAPWMGSWYFVKPHAIYDGLPVATVMKGDYQVPVSSSNGLLVSSPSIEIISAYSKDHSRKIGAGDALVLYGKGRILFHVVPRMNTPFQRRWLANTIRYMGVPQP